MMTIHTEKIQENKTQSVSSTASKHEVSVDNQSFVNSRPDATAQLKMQELANTSTDVQPFMELKIMTENSASVKQFRQSQSLANQYSEVVVQKKDPDLENDETVQRVQWDTVKNGPESHKTEIFNGVSWRKFLVKTDGGTVIEVFKGENKVSLQEESSQGLMMQRDDDAGLFNCHGFTFGGYNAANGPYSFIDAGPVNKILADEYTQSVGPLVGCVVVFGDAAHSGIVVEIKDGSGKLEDRVMVRSKLGTKGFSVESIKSLSRFGKEAYYTKGIQLELEDVDDLELIELQAQEIEERALAILKIEKGVNEIKRLQSILEKVTKGGKPTEEERLFLEEMRQEANARKLEKQGQPVQKVAQLHSLNGSESTSGLSRSIENKTGLPDPIKSGVENLSGYSMDDVKVHYNSNKPAQLQAHAYAQGTEIHVAPGQEKHLPHEAWHVVQQKQGRVKPTMQLKEKVAINDDVQLEREADEMGAKAVQMKHSPDSVTRTISAPTTSHSVQRQINLNEKAYTLEEVTLLVLKGFPKEADKKLIRERILPVMDLHNQSFKSAQHLIGQLQMVVAILGPWINLDPDMPLAALIQQQDRLQRAYKDLESSGFFKYLMTTTGFEHEFADMVDSPLAGLSHIELAKSKESMPLTSIPFIIETDAGNALELVSPPFLLPTVAGVPLPDPDVVGQIDNLMRKELSDITPPLPTPKEELLGKKYSTIAFANVMGSLEKKTGLNFINTDLKLKPEQISHNVDPAKLAQSLEVQGGEKDSITFDEDEKSPKIGSEATLHINKKILDQIQVGKSKKSGKEKYQVSSQVNFATDLKTASLLMEPSEVGGAKIYRDLESLMATGIQLGTLTQPGTQLLSRYLVKQLCSLFSVYSQAHLNITQQEFYRQVEKEVTNSGTGGAQISGLAKKEFQLHAGLSSYVKDSTLIWVKDHLESLASGVLKTTDDYAEAFLLARNTLQFVKEWALPGEIRELLLSKGHANPAEHWEDFQLNLLKAIPQLMSSLEENGEEISTRKDKTPDVELYGHDDAFIGARQDTYLDPKRVQQTGLWDSRLVVAEIRRGDPEDQLKKAKGRL